MRHVLGWLLTLLVIGAMSLMVYELLHRGGVYAALVPWALAASLGFVFWWASAPHSADRVSARVLALVGSRQEILVRRIAEGIETGDLIQVSARFASHPLIAPQLVGGRAQLNNGGAFANVLKVEPGMLR